MMSYNVINPFVTEFCSWNRLNQSICTAIGMFFFSEKHCFQNNLDFSMSRAEQDQRACKIDSIRINGEAI